jgi:hypothetical protein
MVLQLDYGILPSNPVTDSDPNTGLAPTPFG